MHRNAMTSRFVLFISSNNRSNNLPTRNKVQTFCRDRGFTVLRTDPYYFACELSQDADLGERITPILVCDLPYGKIASGRNFAFLEENQNWKLWHEKAEAEAQLYNLIYASADSLIIESDPLGLKPIYKVATQDGMLITNSIADLISIVPNSSKCLDRTSLTQFFMMGYTFGPRTFHKDVYRTATGERIEWSNDGGLKFSRPRRYKISNKITFDIYLSRALQRVEQVLSKSLQRHCSGARKPINVALSGGFDSRILAAAMKKENFPIRTFTYGRWHHRELRTARRIAKSLNVEHSFLDYPLDNFYQNFPLFMSVVEGHGESKITQITNLLQIDTDDGAPLVHGFLSDAIAGSHLTDWFPNDDLNDLDEVADRLAKILVPQTTKLALAEKILGFKFDLDAFRDEIRSELRTTEKPYQAAILWDIESRQRGLISPHLLMLGQKFDVIAPFYDREMLETWVSMPRIALDKRYLQRQQLAHQFSELAKIPRDQEDAPIIPNLKNQILLFVDTLARRFFLKLYGNITGYRPESIWSLGQGLANDSQIEKMNASIREKKNVLDDVFDLKFDLSDSTRELIRSAPDSGDFQTTRLVFQMIEYAGWIQALHQDK